MPRKPANDEVQRSLGRLEGALEATQQTLNEHGASIKAIEGEMKDVKSGLFAIHNTLETNTKELGVHIAGVQELRRYNETHRAELDKRFEPLEELEQNIAFTKKLFKILPWLLSPHALYYLFKIVKEFLMTH